MGNAWYGFAGPTSLDSGAGLVTDLRWRPALEMERVPMANRREGGSDHDKQHQPIRAR